MTTKFIITREKEQWVRSPTTETPTEYLYVVAGERLYRLDIKVFKHTVKKRTYKVSLKL